MRDLLRLALFASGMVVVQPTVTWTGESPEWTCRDSPGAVLSMLARADPAETCSRRALAAPGQARGTRPNGYRVTANERVVIPAPTPDPVPNSAGVPLRFDDPVFANTRSVNSRMTLSSGSSRTDLSIVESSGEPTITCSGSCTLTRIRIQSREGIRCIGGTINLTWVYVAATGVGRDHADGLQCYAPGSTGTVTVKNSTFKMAGVTTAGYFSADGWRGTHLFENVLFEGGSYGLRIPADGGSSVGLKNVYFVRGSFSYGAFLFDVVNGRRINIAQWENVRWASWQGDQLVIGGLIPRP